MSAATLQQIFWNESERRLHAGWRLLIYFVLWRVASSLFDLLLAPPVATFWQNVSALLTVEGAWFERTVHFLLYLVSVLLVTVAAARWLDRRPLRSYGLRLDSAWWWDLLGGLLIGAGLMTLIVLPLLLQAFPMSAAAAEGLRHGLGGSTEAVPSASAVRSWSIACARSSKRSKLRFTESGRPGPIAFSTPAAVDSNRGVDSRTLAAEACACSAASRPSSTACDCSSSAGQPRARSVFSTASA